MAHIGIRPSSFGKFIIINHPNGYSTLYAHLNKFYPELEKYVREKQTEKESWAIEIDFSEDDFKVKKGKRSVKAEIQAAHRARICILKSEKQKPTGVLTRYCSACRCTMMFRLLY